MAVEEDVVSSLTCNLPGEMVLKILSQLPVKFLMRFKCVKKSWNSLSKNPFFIKIHTNHHQSPKQEKECFLVCASKHIAKHYDLTELSLIPFKSDQWEPLGIHEEEYYEIVGSSNGLICLAKHDSAHCMILNPATREVKHTNTNVKVADRFDKCYRYTTIGFGLDQEHEDFKIMFVAEQREEKTHRLMYSEANVYSLNTDSWKKIHKPSELHLASQLSSCKNYTLHVELHNHLHWPVYISERFRKIARFGLATESFDYMALPHLREHNQIWRNEPHIHRWRQDEHLAVVYYKDFHKIFEVWTQVRYGDVNSWMKELTFRFPDGLDAMVYVSQRNGDFVFSSRKWEVPLLYLVGNNEIKDSGIPNKDSAYKVVFYKESLVRVNGKTLVRGTSKIGMSKRVSRIKSKFNRAFEQLVWWIFLAFIPFAVVGFVFLVLVMVYLVYLNPWEFLAMIPKVVASNLVFVSFLVLCIKIINTLC